MEKVAEKYGKQALFLFVYCREAHPDGDRNFKTLTKKNEPIKQALTFEERKSMARQFCDDMQAARRILVDELEPRSVQRTYGGRPNPTFVVGLDGKIILKLAWTNGDVLERFLREALPHGATFDADRARRMGQPGPMLPGKRPTP